MTTPSVDYLAGYIKHLVKGGEHCEGIRDRLINAAPGRSAHSPRQNALRPAALPTRNPTTGMAKLSFIARVLSKQAIVG
jgi:hypothetical protein